MEPLDSERHTGELYRANSADEVGRVWTYLPIGPFADLASYREWVEQAASDDDRLFYAVVPAGDDRTVGVAALQRIDEGAGTVEVGYVTYSPELQGTTAAAEAIVLLMRLVFDGLAYRRFEWKWDALNAPSRRAAQRFGFLYGGTFRQAVVVKGQTGTRPGFRSSTPSGRPCERPTSAGFPPTTSTATAGSASRSPPSPRASVGSPEREPKRSS